MHASHACITYMHNMHALAFAMHSVRIQHALEMHLTCIPHAFGLQWACIWHALDMRWACIRLVLDMRIYLHPLCMCVHECMPRRGLCDDLQNGSFRDWVLSLSCWNGPFQLQHSERRSRLGSGMVHSRISMSRGIAAHCPEWFIPASEWLAAYPIECRMVHSASACRWASLLVARNGPFRIHSDNVESRNGPF